MPRAQSTLAVGDTGQLEPGALIDGFLVERVLSLGIGNRALVQAVAPSGARVALKQLDDAATGPDARRHILALVRIRASIEHPHLVRVFGAREHAGRLYLVSALPAARTLAERLREGALPPSEAVHMAAGLAGALETAAERGLLHADLSPESILLAADRRAHGLLTDFGIGRVRSRQLNLRQTVGEADYRAPEEIKGEPLQPRSNAYSLACVLFECLTGAPPYPYERPLLTLHAHLVEPPPRPSAIAPELPAQLDEVFAAALAKEPGRRLGSVAFVQAAAAALDVRVTIPSEAAAAEATRSRRPKRGRAPGPPARRPEPPAEPPRSTREAERRPRAPEPPAHRATDGRPGARRPAERPASPPAADRRPHATPPPSHETASRARLRPARDARTPARHRHLRPRPAVALALVALAASAAGGLALGSSNGAPQRPSAPKPNVEAASAELARAQYVRAVSPVIERLSARRTAARRRLGRARLPDGQAAAAQALVSAYAGARRDLAAEPSSSPDAAPLRDGLRGAERAYRRLAAAARAQDRRAWRSASRAAVQSERALERALRALASP